MVPFSRACSSVVLDGSRVFPSHFHTAEVKSDLFKHTPFPLRMEKQHEKLEAFIPALRIWKLVIHCRPLVLEQKRYCLYWVFHSTYSALEEKTKRNP